MTEPDYNIALPDVAKYHVVNSDSKFCGLELEKIVEYLAKFDTELGNTEKEIYNEKYSMYYRFTTENNRTFITSKSHSQHRTAV